ncbi:hypothetical protein HMPREF1868_00573 [Olsenella sp. DNF00959]|nr:hypothetical protein HMPREF1868_00573 [Olsenella sp. DNF00959]
MPFLKTLWHEPPVPCARWSRMGLARTVAGGARRGEKPWQPT